MTQPTSRDADHRSGPDELPEAVALATDASRRDGLEAIRAMTSGGPAVELRTAKRPPPETIRDWWTPRRLAVMTLAWPLATMLTWSVAGDVQSALVIALVGFGIALSLTTYTPAPGQTFRQILGSPCASVGGVLPAVCAIPLLASPSVHVSAPVVLVIFALTQRFFGSQACGIPCRGRS